MVDVGQGKWAHEVEFVGRWLLVPEPGEATAKSPVKGARAVYGVAETQGGMIAVHVTHCDGEVAPLLYVYTHFQAAGEAGVPTAILAIAANAAGTKYRKRLDL